MVVGLSTALLAWGLLGTGERWRLLVLISFPAVACVQVANWSMLLLAAMYVPGLAALAVLAKPHAGLPVFVARAWAAPWDYVVPVGVICLISLLVRPTWPMEFLGAIKGYTGGPALLALPGGPLLLLAALRWRQGSAMWLLLCALVPLRAYYDWLLLAPLFASRPAVLAWVAASWAGYAAFYFGSSPLAMALIWGSALAAVLLDREGLAWSAWTLKLRGSVPARARTPIPSSAD